MEYARKEIFEKKYGILLTDDLKNRVSEMCNYSDFIEDRGFEKGLERGIEQGLAKGKREAANNPARSLNISLEEAAKLIGVSPDILNLNIESCTFCPKLSDKGH